MNILVIDLASCIFFHIAKSRKETKSYPTFRCLLLILLRIYCKLFRHLVVFVKDNNDNEILH